MKRLFTSICFVMAIALCQAQTPYKLSAVMQAEGKTAEQIYNSIKAWSATAFVSAKAALQVDNPDNFFISFRTSEEYLSGGFMTLAYDGWFQYTLTIQCRDGRYKVEANNVTHKNKPGNSPSCCLGILMTENNYSGINVKYHIKVAEDIKARVSLAFEDICQSLQDAVNQDGQTTEDDW